MPRRIISEPVAKAVIYLVFSISVFAFLFFWFDARGYQAASPDPQQAQPLAAVASTSTDTPSPRGAVPAYAYADTEPAEEEDTHEETLAAWDAWLSSFQAEVEKDGGRLLDDSVLEAEIDRLAAMGHTVPEAQPEYMGEFYATAYCCEAYKHICGGNGVTASGTVPTQGVTVASDWRVLPPGTWLYIEDVGIRRVEDSGSAIKKNRLDVAIDTHDNALRWRGLGNHNVWVLSWPEED